MSKKSGPIEYKDIEYIIRFNFFAGEDEIKRILNVFVNAVQEYNKEEERGGKNN